MPFDSWYIAHLKNGLFYIQWKIKLYFTHGGWKYRLQQTNKETKLLEVLEAFLKQDETSPSLSVCTYRLLRELSVPSATAFDSNRMMYQNQHLEKPHQVLPEHNCFQNKLIQEKFSHTVLEQVKNDMLIF